MDQDKCTAAPLCNPRPRHRFSCKNLFNKKEKKRGSALLIEAGGLLQGVPDFGGQVPGVLGAAPELLLALGVEHVAHVVEGPRLAHLQTQSSQRL